MSIIEKALAKQKAKQKTDDNKSSIEQAVENKKQTTKNNNAEITKAEFNTDNSATNPVKTVSVDNGDIILDKKSLNKRGFMFDGTCRRQAQEEFRGIKRKLLNNAFGSAAKTLDHSNLIMVTSSNPNEGKTFISINLALSIALEQDKTVLLIDADVLRPSINRELEFSHRNGLLEYLLSEVTSLSDIIYSTNIKNLKIVPAGKPHNLTNELLASDKMAALAKELAERYPDRIVIFDCPPILGVTETPVLANLMGQAIVVVEESKTKLDDVIRATGQLNEDLAIGLIMNKTLKSTRESYGYYGYGYGSQAK
ncbi:MAG: exopolysaccharide biosynthesis protein [Gammaproteobacteria bacterium]|nr:MAG: exopolysaccharide biosynthesis protein [Gammaproteobacteria bacterium]